MANFNEEFKDFIKLILETKRMEYKKNDYGIFIIIIFFLIILTSRTGIIIMQEKTHRLYMF